MITTRRTNYSTFGNVCKLMAHIVETSIEKVNICSVQFLSEKTKLYEIFCHWVRKRQVHTITSEHFNEEHVMIQCASYCSYTLSLQRNFHQT